MSDAEIAFRIGLADKAKINEAVAQMQAERPEFYAAYCSLACRVHNGTVGQIGDGHIIQWIKDFLDSPAGQFLIAALKALLLVLPFIMTPAAKGWTVTHSTVPIVSGEWTAVCEAFKATPASTMQAAPAQSKPVRDVAYALRVVERILNAKDAGNWRGPGGVLPLAIELAEHFQEPEAAALVRSLFQPEVSMSALSDLIGQFEVVVADVVSGNELQAWKDSIPLQQAALDFEKSLAGVQATPTDMALAVRYAAVGDNLRSACVQIATAPAKVGADAGGIFPGDGSFLKSLAAFLLTLWQIIGPWIKPTPAPAP